MRTKTHQWKELLTEEFFKEQSPTPGSVAQIFMQLEKLRGEKCYPFELLFRCGLECERCKYASEEGSRTIPCPAAC